MNIEKLALEREPGDFSGAKSISFRFSFFCLSSSKSLELEESEYISIFVGASFFLLVLVKLRVGAFLRFCEVVLKEESLELSELKSKADEEIIFFLFGRSHNFSSLLSDDE